MSELGGHGEPRLPIDFDVDETPARDDRGRVTGQGEIALAGVGGPEIVKFPESEFVSGLGPSVVHTVVPLPPGHRIGDEIPGRALFGRCTPEALEGTGGGRHPAIHMVTASTFGSRRDVDRPADNGLPQRGSAIQHRSLALAQPELTGKFDDRGNPRMTGRSQAIRTLVNGISVEPQRRLGANMGAPADERSR